MIGSFSKGDQNEVTCGDAGYACPTCGKKFKKVRTTRFIYALIANNKYLIKI